MPKNSCHKMENGYWQKWVLETTCNLFSCIVSTKNIKICCSTWKNKLMFPMTHLSLKIFPNGTAFDVIFIDSPIFNRNIVHGIMNMIRWKYSITATNSSEGSIDTTNLPQRIIGPWKGILGFIVNYHPPPNNNNVMITSMCSHHWYDQRKFHIP